MNTDSKGNRSHSFREAVHFALSGVIIAVKSERNFRIHLTAAIIVLLSAALLSVSVLELTILILVIAITLTLELINTAIERIVDLITIEENPLAKAAKDVAAGAVLLFSFFSVIIGVLIFYEPVITLLWQLIR